MANADWDLGQKLIEQGACSMDQVGEILSLQAGMRRMGAASKPFARVLLEKGYVRRDQLLQAGVRQSELPPPVQERIAPKATPPVPRRPLIVAAVILIAVRGLVLFALRAF